MDNETEQIFKEQLGKLPKEVVSFLSSANWDTDLDEIGALYNLTEEEMGDFKSEVTLVLAGLIHPDDFKKALEEEVGIKGAVLDAIVANVENKIFAPIRPALIEFFDGEASESESQKSKVKSDTEEMPAIAPAPESPRAWGKEADIAPDNLPTGEAESFLPNLAPKTSVEAGEPTHPFEEKMKKVFTAGQQSMGDLAIEPVPQATTMQAPKAPPVYHADPYREAIE